MQPANSSLIQRWNEHPRLRHISPDGLPDYILSSMLGISDYYAGFDSSHDESHGIRVFHLGRRIYSRMKQLNPDYRLYDNQQIISEALALQIVDLACVFHDFFDRKYFRTKDAYAARRALLEKLLIEHGGIYEEWTVLVLLISEKSGFSKMELCDGKLVAPDLGLAQDMLSVMSDADRLDAVIGADSVDRSAQFQLYRINWLIAEGRNENNKHQYDRYVAPIANLDDPVQVKKQAWQLAIFYTLEQEPGCRSERASTIVTPAGREILAAGEQAAIDRALQVKVSIAEGKVPWL